MNTLQIYENAVYLPYNNLGIIIKDMDKEKINQHIVWCEGLLHAYDVNNKREYKVMIYQVNNHSVLLKPIESYNCMIFEQIFGFEYNCEGFSKDKVINIFSKKL